MTVSIVCRHCGIGFKSFPGSARNFCSMDCYRAEQRSGVFKRGPGPDVPRTPCAHCAAEVTKQPAKKRDGANADRVFCNRSCYDSFRTAVRSEKKKICPHCTAEFIPKKTTGSQAKYCADACWKAAKKASPKNCVNCKCLFTPVKPNSAGDFISHNAGKTCSAWCHNQWIRNDPERKRKIGDAFRGDKHPNWQGGKSLLNNTSSRGPNWQRQRAKALKRDCYQCQDCGMTEDQCRSAYGRGLDVDHTAPFHNFSDYRKANALSNLKCLCASCHRKIEATRGMVQMVLPMQSSTARQHRGYVRGERVNTAGLKEFQVLEMRRLFAEGCTPIEIAAKFGISKSNSYQVLSNATWKHLLPSSAGI